VNLALNKPSTASSSSNATDRAPFNANDGDMGTRWGANQNGNDYWQVDLGAKYNLTKVNIYWEASYAQSYSIQVSDTGADGSWQTVYTNPANASTANVIPLTGAAGRFVRMQADGNGPAGYGVSMYEFEVYGTPYAGK